MIAWRDTPLPLPRRRLERGVEFCLQSVRATAEAAEEAHNGDTEGAEHDRERPQMRQFIRELNALVHRQFRERTGGPVVIFTNRRESATTTNPIGDIGRICGERSTTSAYARRAIPGT